MLKRLLIIVLLFTLCRIVFWLFNYHSFAESSLEDLLVAFLHGIRFDIASVLYINSVFILLSIVEGFIRFNDLWKRIQAWIFYISNIIGVFINLIDIEYYHFQKKRTTVELFSGENDIFKMLPEYIRSYWYILLIVTVLGFIMIRLYKRTNYNDSRERRDYYPLKIISYILLLGIFIVGMRGGLQQKPITTITASAIGNSQNAALVLNTPFTIIHSLGKKTLEEKKYFTAEECEKIYTIKRQYDSKYLFQKKNVVIIILESFSKEWIGSLSGKKTYAPFLDSLIGHSLVFDNAFANGKKSNEALPSILASLPSLMEESFTGSVYQDNELRALPEILKEYGYHTSFYHGGINGTMNFDAFVKKAGVDHYYGLNEYPYKKDYDGNWGIYDEPYFQYFYWQLTSTPPPFFSTIFSLSSHHPYSLPKQYKNKFNDAETAELKTFRYTDEALRKFFKSASQRKWYYNTVFVITGDHTSASPDAYWDNMINHYRVPLIFFEPGTDHLKGRNTTIAQQIDIMPTILNYLGYSGNFNAFGESLLEKKKYDFAVTSMNGIYQIVDSSFVMQFSGDKAIALYDYQKDSLLKNNIENNLVQKEQLEKKIKAYIQTYNYTLLENNLEK
jgi:phosphoglycerol transferase MdoB-like AlkP superfamily enzyme